MRFWLASLGERRTHSLVLRRLLETLTTLCRFS